MLAIRKLIITQPDGVLSGWVFKLILKEFPYYFSPDIMEVTSYKLLKITY